MKVSEMFPSKFVAAEDLKGVEAAVTIEAVQMEAINADGGQEEKPVVRFVGMKKGLVLNVTNATAIAGPYGQETDNWVGKEVTLRPDVCDFKGKPTNCIRVHITPEQAQRSMAVQQPQAPSASPSF